MPRPRLIMTFAVAALLVISGCAQTGTTEQSSDDHDESREWAAKKLASMSLEDKVGQMFVHYAYGQSAGTTNADDVKKNQELHGVDNAKQLIDKYHLGGMIYFAWSNNTDNPEQIAKLSNGNQKIAMAQEAEVPLLVSTDQETGSVVRMGAPATEFPGNMALGAGRDRGDARKAGAIAGAELRDVGINQNFAPSGDVNVNPANPVIGVRSYGSDPKLVAQLTSSQIKGYQGKNGLSATVKHFPGHGDTHEDSHTDLPKIDHTREQWEKLDAPPFESAIKSGVDSVMTAHIQFPALDDSGDPATLSKPILTGMLREELGYDGVVVTDSLSMAGVREMYPDKEVPIRAIKAGADQMLMPPDLDLAINSVLDAVKSGELTEKRIDKSVMRLLMLKHKRGVIDNPFVDADKVSDTVGTDKNLDAARAITEKTTTLVKNDEKTLPLPSDTGKVLVAGDGADATSTLAEQLTKHGPAANALDTGTDPDAATIDKAVKQAKGSDAVVVATNTVRDHPQQAKLVEALRGSGTPVAVVGVKEPYDINRFPDTETYVAAYGSNTPALSAAAKVLCGKVNPQGKLPVMIPEANDPEKPLFEYGHGLSYE